VFQGPKIFVAVFFLVLFGVPHRQLETAKRLVMINENT